MKILLSCFIALSFIAVPCVKAGESAYPKETVRIGIEESISNYSNLSREAEEIVFEEWHVTGYCLCEECCGKTDGIGASGVKVQPGISIASGSDIPFGTKIWVDGIGFRTVHDRGSAIGEKEIDVLFETHEQAVEFGSKILKVRIIDGD